MAANRLSAALDTGVRLHAGLECRKTGDPGEQTLVDNVDYRAALQHRRGRYLRAQDRDRFLSTPPAFL